MNKIWKSITAIILCMSMVLGLLPAQLIGEDIAKAAISSAPEAMPEFQALLEQLATGKEKTYGEWQYVLFPEQQYAVITAYLGPDIAEVKVPDRLDGADVVGIADHAFDGKETLISVTVPVNVYIMGREAIPRGTAVCAANASYARNWARQNGHAFRNTSELDFQSGVADLAETRPENFLRVSAVEVKLRELEAKRLKAGSLFFLPDPANLYQISYYRVESISEPAGGFVTIRCSTPEIEDVLVSISGENEIMMPDYSTMKLEPGVEVIGQERKQQPKKSHSSSFKLSIPKVDLGNNAKFYAEASFESKWETTYDIKAFGDKKVKLVESRTISFKLGLEKKSDKLFMDETQVSNLDAAKRLVEDKKKEHLLADNGQSTIVPYKRKMCTIVICSIYGVVNINANIYFAGEFSGKAELNCSNTCKITTTYKNGKIERDVQSGEKDTSLIAEGTLKVGISGAFELYILGVKVFTIDLFAGLKAKATFDYDLLYSTYDQQNENYYNVNMDDCIVIKADYIVEGSFSLGLIDKMAIEDKKEIFSMPAWEDNAHWHFWPVVYKLEDGEWIEKGSKEHFHLAEDCPYDYKDINFVLPDVNGRDIQLKRIDRVLPGAQIQEPDELIERVATGWRRKIVGWYTDKSFCEEAQVGFPVTIRKSKEEKKPKECIFDDTTLYAKTNRYHTVHLINAAGRELGTFNTKINRGYALEDWYMDSAEIAGEESFTLPSVFTTNEERTKTVAQWLQVKANGQFVELIGNAYNPGDTYTVDESEGDSIWLMALTSEDIAGHFVRKYNDLNQTIDIYTSIGGVITCPELDDTYSSEFIGWTVTASEDPDDTVIAVLDKGENFSTSGREEKDFTFYPRWQEKQNVNYAELDGPIVGSMAGYTGGSVTSLNDLIISDQTVTGIRDGAVITHLSIPAEDSDGEPITGIDDGAFEGNTDLISVYIPPTITSIGYNAFSNCTGLRYIAAESAAITYLPNGFANGCTSLRGCSVPVDLEEVGSYAFEGCTTITSIRLNSIIYGSAFMNCTGLSSVSLGGGCSLIDTFAFANCTGLTELTIPECVRGLGTRFIEGCLNLRKLTIAAHICLTSEMLVIGEGSLLAEIDLQEGVKELGDEALANDSYGFAQLTKISLPTTLEAIGSRILAGSGIRELSIYLPQFSAFDGLQFAAYGVFCNMPNLETLTVLGGRIPGSAFSGNTSLKHVTVRGGKIGNNAFEGCTGLETVTLCEGVVSIGDDAFKDCTSLTSLVIPDSVTHLGDEFLKGCSNLTCLKVGGGIPVLENKTDVYYPFFIGEGSKLNTLILGEGIEALEYALFQNSREYPFGVQNDEHYYFPMLTNVELPESLTSLGSDVFYGTAITEIVLSNGLASGNSVLSDMPTLKKVTVKGGEIGEEAFANCTNLGTVILEEGVTGIGDYAFENCILLSSLTIPDSVKQLGNKFLDGCINLTYLKVGGGISVLENEEREKYPFFIGEGSKLNTLILGEGITTIGDGVFRNGWEANSFPYYYYYSFKNLTHIELPDTLTNLGRNVFYGSAITEVVLADGLASADGGVFSNIDTLKKVTIKGGAIGSSAFSGCVNLETVILEEGVTSIGDYAFDGCTKLTSLTIPDSVTYLGDRFLNGCINLTYLKVGGGISALENEKREYYPFFIGEGSKLNTLILGEGITTIGDGVFRNGWEADSFPYYYYYSFKNLTHIELPNTLTNLGRNVFYGSAITEVVLADGLASADGGVYEDIDTLKKVTIKGGAIGSSAFSGCVNLETVILEEGVTSIGDYAFDGCTKLTSLTIPDSVTYLGDRFLNGCINLTYLKVGGGTAALENKKMEYYPFSIGEGSKLNTLILGEGITTLGDSLFRNGQELSAFPYYDYHSFTNLTHIELPGTLASIGDNVFYGAPIQELVLANGLAMKDGGTFDGMKSLRKVTIKGGPVGREAFSGCDKLETVILDEGVTSIGNSAFAGCKSLISLTIPNSVTSLGSYIIEGCENLRYLKVGGGVPVLENNKESDYYPFYIGQYTSLDTLVLGEGISKVGNGVFNNDGSNDRFDRYTFPNLKEVVLPSTLRILEGDNISNWESLTNLILPDGLETMEDDYVNNSVQFALYSNRFNQAIQDFALERGVNYVYGSGAAYPNGELICVAPADGLSNQGLTVSNGLTPATRGTTGEETMIPRGFAILNESSVQFGSPVSPVDPVCKEGYAFYGWYADPEYTMPWTMGTMPDADLTLYARIAPLVRVRYIINLPGSADSTMPIGFSVWQEYGLREYSAIPVPEDPSPEGYAFAGWFMDRAFTQQYIPNAVKTQDITIYGQLQKAPVGAIYRQENDEYTLTGYRLTENDSDDIKIPAKVNGIPVTAIGPYAFQESGVKSVTLPDTITTIDPDAFTDSTVCSVYVSKNNPVYSAKGGVLYNKDGDTLIRWPGGRKNAEFTVPAGTRIIGEYAFKNNKYLKTVTFCDGLERIARGAFSGCGELQRVELPDSVSVLEADAFAGCYEMTLFSAYGLTTIGENAIPAGAGLAGYGLTGDNPLRRIFAIENEDGEEEIWGYNEYAVKLYVDGVLTEQMGCEAGFPLSTELKDVTFDDGTMITGWYRDAEYGEIWDLDTDVMPAADLELYGSKTAVYSYEPATVTSGGTDYSGIRLTAYHGNARTLIIPETYSGENVIAIDDGFLSGYTGTLQEITIPACVLSIGSNALAGFSGMVVCDGESYVEGWAESKGYRTSLMLYELILHQDEEKETVYELAKGTAQRLPVPTKAGAIFQGWYEDEAHNQPVSLTDNCYEMPGCDTELYALWETTQEAQQLPFTWTETVSGIAITGYTGTSDSVMIPATIGGVSVTVIAENAFTGKPIRSINLGQVEVIEDGAFYDCDCLAQINLPDSVTAIGEYAFGECSALRCITIGTGLSEFPVNAVSGCKVLKNLIADEAHPELSSVDGVLFNKDKTEQVCYPRGKAAQTYTIPNTVTRIGDGAFRNADSLEEIVIPATVTQIGEEAFMGCSRLEAIEASGLISVGESAFFGCTALTAFHPGTQLASIGNYAFLGCSSLTDAVIPEGAELNTDDVLFSRSNELIITGTWGSSAWTYANTNGISFNDPDAAHVTGISVSGMPESLLRGQTVLLTVNVTPAEAMIGNDYAWQTTDPKVAFVDKNNVLRAVGTGEATIVVKTGNGVTAEYTVEVTAAVEELQAAAIPEMEIGDIVTPIITIVPTDAAEQKLTWTCSDETVAVYDAENGTITAVGSGTADFTVMAENGVSVTLRVSVYAPVEQVNIRVGSDRLFLIPGCEYQQAEAAFVPAYATYGEVEWESSDPSVIEIDEDGRMTAKAAGTAEITVTHTGRDGEVISGSMLITVIAPVQISTLPNALTTIQEEAFAGDDSMEYLILPWYTSGIGNKAFANMNGLELIVIPGAAKNIAGNAFDGSEPVIAAPKGSAGYNYAVQHGLDWIDTN